MRSLLLLVVIFVFSISLARATDPRSLEGRQPRRDRHHGIGSSQPQRGRLHGLGQGNLLNGDDSDKQGRDDNGNTRGMEHDHRVIYYCGSVSFFSLLPFLYSLHIMALP